MNKDYRIRKQLENKVLALDPDSKNISEQIRSLQAEVADFRLNGVLRLAAKVGKTADQKADEAFAEIRKMFGS